jgi:hypothetical protein
MSHCSLYRGGVAPVLNQVLKGPTIVRDPARGSGRSRIALWRAHDHA